MRVQGVLRNRDLLYFYMSTSKVFSNYTDFHDVDEDLRTIMYQGGRWFNGSYAGIMHRGIDNSPTTSDIVALSNISRLIKYYTDHHNVDEDLATIADVGGWWSHSDMAGITYRTMNNSSPDLLDGVASSNMRNSLIIRIGMVSTKMRRLSRFKADIGVRNYR